MVVNLIFILLPSGPWFEDSSGRVCENEVKYTLHLQRSIQKGLCNPLAQEPQSNSEEEPAIHIHS